MAATHVEATPDLSRRDLSRLRVLLLSHQRDMRAATVVGTHYTLDIHGTIPPDADSFTVQGTPGVSVTISYDPEQMRSRPSEGLWPLDKGVQVILSTAVISEHSMDKKVNVSYYRRVDKVLLGSARLYITSIVLSLHVDINRDGIVEKELASKAFWTWGPHGHGAVLLVNCDKDTTEANQLDSADNEVTNIKDLEDMSLMILRCQGPSAIFKTHKVQLYVSPANSDKLGVFHKNTNTDSGIKFNHVLGSKKLFYEIENTEEKEHTFYVEGLSFPDAGFPGLVSIGVALLDSSHEILPETQVFVEEVVFRIAPWIMTPNTQPPEEVYVCKLDENSIFVEQVSEVVRKANSSLRIISQVENRGDRWIQDEMEFGYIEAPHKRFPVVFDSPRNRELKEFPFSKILGPDFGYITREPAIQKEVTTLDSFGNLEVSPPVTVRGKAYPLGRILIGSVTLTDNGNRMAKVVREFLFAQQVQAPVELFTNWLKVGHVDEFLTFVPTHSQKGFRLLLASTTACYQLFKEKQEQGHGGSLMFQGLDTTQKTIDEILSDEKLRKVCLYAQSCINWNRKVLKRELGLTEQDIVEIPALFVLDDVLMTANAFFPNMVNMLVLGNQLAIAKPFGPIINGKCCLEEEVRSILEPLGLNCNFIDDFKTYHHWCGDVHCGTNVRRKPFSFKWWNMNLPALNSKEILASL